MTLTQLSVVVGGLMPLLVAFVQQHKWPDWARALAMLASSLVAGAITTVADGKLTPSDWVASVFTIAIAAGASYHTFWKPTGVAGWIEKKTTATLPLFTLAVTVAVLALPAAASARPPVTLALMEKTLGPPQASHVVAANRVRSAYRCYLWADKGRRYAAAFCIQLH